MTTTNVLEPHSMKPHSVELKPRSIRLKQLRMKVKMPMKMKVTKRTAVMSCVKVDRENANKKLP